MSCKLESVPLPQLLIVLGIATQTSTSFLSLTSDKRLHSKVHCCCLVLHSFKYRQPCFERWDRYALSLSYVWFINVYLHIVKFSFTLVNPPLGRSIPPPSRKWKSVKYNTFVAVAQKCRLLNYCNPYCM